MRRVVILVLLLATLVWAKNHTWVSLKCLNGLHFTKPCKPLPDGIHAECDKVIITIGCISLTEDQGGNLRCEAVDGK